MGDGELRPRRRATRSVRVRITAAATLVTAAAVSLAGWMLVRSVENSQLGSVRDRTERRIDEVADALADGEDPWTAVESTTANVYVEIVDSEGRSVAAGPQLAVGERRFFVQLGPGSAEAGGGSASDSDSDSDSGSGSAPPPGAQGSLPDENRCLASRPGGDPVPVEVDCPPGPPPPGGEPQAVGAGAVSQHPLEMVTRQVDTDRGELTVGAAAPVDEVRRSVDAVRRALVIGLPGVVLLVIVVAWTLVGRALRPVEVIRSEVESITGSTIHRRVPEPGADDEIGRLAETMNAMLGRLEAAQVRQRQFVSDASHELRSPVTAIRSDLEVALHEGADAEWPAVARAVLGEEARLERLLDDLLMLAATDEAAEPPPATPVDVAALAGEEAARSRAVPVRVRAPVEGDDGDGVLVLGAAHQIARVVTNLVDNAARHARSTVEVAVTPVPSSGIVRLTVDDDGPGIAPGDRERVFERFTRLDEARARRDGGAGLGLAVVRSIVTRHRGRVWVEDAPLGGARFVVELASWGTSGS
jgi:signal transduction histidine kinase